MHSSLRYIRHFFWLILLVMQCAVAQHSIKFGLHQNKPLNFTDNDGQNKGLVISVFNNIAVKEDWDVEYVPCVWADCLTKLEAGEIDLLSAIGYTTKREKIYDFNLVSMITNWGLLLTQPKSEIQSILDLEGKKIGVMKNAGHTRAFHKLAMDFNINVEYEEVDDFLSVFQLIDEKKVDAGVVNRLIAMQFSNDYQVAKSSIIYNPIEIRFAATKNKHIKVLETIDHHLEQLKTNESSIYHQSLEKWFGGIESNKLPYWLKWAVLIVILIFVFLISMNWLLNQRVKKNHCELIQEIDGHKETSKSLTESERRYRGLIEDIPDLLYRTDLEGRITFISTSVYELSGYTVDEAIGMKMAEEVYVYPETREKLISDLMNNGIVKDFENEMYRKDGSIWWGSANAHLLKSESGDIIGVEGIVRDITEKKSTEKELNYQASHDQLTGLINRNEFERRAERLLLNLKFDDLEHALCFMDLDQFKVVNDTCGHVAGDELLRQLSRKMQAVVRKRDTLARIGGDEFGVLLEHCSLSKAKRVAESLRVAIQDYEFIWDNKLFRVGISIGLVAITESSTSLTTVLKQADAACFMAKDLGRNRIHIYHEEDAAMASRYGEMQWVSRINQAIDDDRFCLYAQSIVDLNSTDNKHYEILIRMVDEMGEIVPPGAFLPAAERYNLISKIDIWVIKNTFLLLSSHIDFLSEVDFISINLSGPSITSDSFHEFIMQEVDKANIDPQKICFEITETVTISNLNVARAFISKLRGVGFRFALDDFGSGLSSFGYLKNLPVDYLKIDGMFVKDIAVDPIDHAMVKSINEIGHVMGMKTIAEFVENDDIEAMLKVIGVNFVQGYGIGKPKPFKDVVTLGRK